MKKTVLFNLLFWLNCSFLFAQYVQIFTKGATAAAPIANENITVLSEKINLKIDKDFKTAKLTAIYKFRAEKSGFQVPFLLPFIEEEDALFSNDAIYTSKNFSATIDGEKLDLKTLNKEISTTDSVTKSPLFSGFIKNLKESGEFLSQDYIWHDVIHSELYMDDFNYFETNLEEGKHVLEVKSLISRFTDRSKNVIEYSFIYPHLQANNWNSLTSTEITVEQEGIPVKIYTNFGEPEESESSKITHWNLKNTSGKDLRFIWKPKVNPLGKFLSTIKPAGATLLLLLPFIFLHYKWMERKRKSNPDQKFPLTALSGSILIFILAMVIFTFSFDLIDKIIGEHAGKIHGFLYYLTGYLVIVVAGIAYFLIFWGIDKHLKRKYS